MKIYICSGKGEAALEHNAFHKALMDAGIEQYNLIYLSSVIPHNAKIVRKKFHAKKNEYGHKLYVVMAKALAKEKGKKAVAGIGWMTNKKGMGEGIFMEYCGESVQEVKEKIEKSLKEMKNLMKKEFGKINYEIKENECSEEGKISCAVVAAVYKAEGWE